MKTLFFFHLFFSAVSFGQDTQASFVAFAPSIKYKGVEDIRFTPGWGKASSEEYWTYAFLWFLDDEPFVNNEIDPDIYK